MVELGSGSIRRMQLPGRKGVVSEDSRKSNGPRWYSLLAVFLAAGLLAGCSTFNREWRSATARSVPESAITGPWEGTWLSHENGHHGKLRCLITKRDGGYLARFRATYFVILRAEYEVTLNADRKENEWQLVGQADLGSLAGGVYHYDGKATPTRFECRYRCQSDHGIFELRRPQ